MIAIESALPALEQSRRGEDWVGWSYWARALEHAGHSVPPEKRSDLRYMIRATIDLPKQWGPLKGLPRNPKPMLRLLDETSLPEDYRKVGTLTLERIASLTVPVVLIYQEASAFIDTHDYLNAHLPERPIDPAPVDAMGALRTARAAAGGRLGDRRAAARRDRRRPGRRRPGGTGERGRGLMRGMPPGRPGRPGDAVLITGSATGLGLETALHLAEGGFRVFATVRSEASRDAVLAAAAARGVTLEVLQLDLTDGASIESAVAEVVASAGGLYALVNNGGVGLRGCLEDCSEDEIRHLFETNVLGTIAVTRAVLPVMRAAGCGRVITISSVGGRVCGLGRDDVLRDQVGAGGPRRGPGPGAGAVRHPVDRDRARDHRDRALVASTAARPPAPSDPASPYYGLFWASEAIADKIVERSPTRPERRRAHRRRGARRPTSRGFATSSGAAPRS